MLLHAIGMSYALQIQSHDMLYNSEHAFAWVASIVSMANSSPIINC